MDRIDASHLLDALGKIADNVVPSSELNEQVGEVARSLDELHSLLDAGLSQINDNLGRIADALETAKNIPPF